MSETKKIDVNSLYAILLREVENDTVQEVDPNLYHNIAEFLGNIKNHDYDGIESKITESLVKMITEMTSILLKIRIEKATSLDEIDYSNLLDEERFILDSEDELTTKKRNYSFCNTQWKTKTFRDCRRKPPSQINRSTISQTHGSDNGHRSSVIWTI